MKKQALLINVNEMDLILEKTLKQGELWLGNIRAAQNLTKLKENNIKTIITVANNVVINFKSNPNIHHKVYKIEDTEKAQIIDIFDDVNNEIQNGLTQGSVLVHCAAGISRSSACVIAYLMKSLKWTYEKTYYFVKEKRLAINPNPGFKKQLIRYSQILQKENEMPQQKQSQLEMNIYSGYSNTWGKLRKKINQSPQEIFSQLSQNLVKSPIKKIDQLNRTSTPEERQIYRQQLAKKLFVNTFSSKSSVAINNYQSEQSIKSQQSLEKQPIRVKALLSMYKKVDDYTFLESERQK